MRRPARLALALLLAQAGWLGAFDLAECDGDGTLGNAGILLGWTAPTATSIGAVVIDDQGTGPATGIDPAATQTLWEGARSTWLGAGNTNLAIPVPTTATVDAAMLEASLASGDGTRVWMVVKSTTSKAGPPVETGWAAITGTDPGSFLGLTFTVFDLGTRRLVDADVLINDDPPGGGARYYDRNDPPLVLLGSGLFDLQGIMAHELGHFLGSEHSIQAGALMNSGAAPEADLAFTSDDAGVVRHLYPDGSITPPLPDRNNLALTTCTSAPTPTPVLPVVGGGGGGGCQAVPGGNGVGSGAVLVMLLLGALASLGRRLPQPSRRRS